MKLFIKNNILILTIIFYCLTSCELVDVTDVDPVYQIDEENVITNITQAESALNGVYALLIKGSQFGEAYISTLPGITGLMGLTQKPGIFAGTPAGELDFFTNEARPDNGYIADYYPAIYELINNANHVIEKTALLTTNESRKDEIVAEAKFLRALSHFYLLRLHGEFFDLNSTYGIVLKTTPTTSSAAQARANVEQSYQVIIDDLDDAIKFGPDFYTTIYASKLAAKALKCKVLLYKKDYAASAALAFEVINSGQRELETDFADVFTKKITNPLEVIFQTNFDSNNERNNKQSYFTYFYEVSNTYKSLLDNDTRYNSAIASTSRGFRNKKFVNSDNINRRVPDTEYFLRLAEMYLIYAEATLRADSSNIVQARDAVNVIRNRSGNTPITTNNAPDLLEDIRKEKILELGAESGEEWFDLVRFHKEGNIDINDFKPLPSITNIILPIPQNSVLVSGGIVIQNPGY